jgi:hypothetical protein
MGFKNNWLKIKVTSSALQALGLLESVLNSS